MFDVATIVVKLRGMAVLVCIWGISARRVGGRVLLQVWIHRIVCIIGCIRIR